jgi:phage shock protein PspC (stress-responsive transcriptional regulator)
MKKTVSVNIKGMNFLIEEDAYELLQSYMNRLTHSLRNEKGSKEIVEDIEFRIAELCSNYLSEKKQVIEKEDIENIVKTLGEPEDYVEDSENQEEKTTSNPGSTEPKQTNINSEKRLYRDLENARIAGVCGGISNYFGIDVVIIRAIFLLVFLFAGFGFPIYIILWILLPKATTSVDRLRMYGRPITAENIKEEVESLANKFKDEGSSLAKKLRKDGSYSERLSTIGKLIRTVAGVFTLGMGLFFTILLFMLIMGSTIISLGSGDQSMSLSDLGAIVLEGKEDVFWAWTGVLMAGLSVIFFLFILGSVLVSNIKNKFTKFSLTFLFFTTVIGIVICSLIGIKTGKEMAFEAEIERVIGTSDCDTLVIESHFEKLNNSKDYTIKSSGNSGFVTLEGRYVRDSGIHFTYIESKDSLFHVHQNLTAHSSSHKNAVEKARNIDHKLVLSNSTLHVNTSFSFPTRDKLRDQEVEIIVEIPRGKSVKINNEIIRIGENHREINININGLDDLDELEKLEYLDTDYNEDELKRQGELNSDGSYESWD